MHQPKLSSVAMIAVMAMLVASCGGGSGGDESGLGDVFEGIGEAAGENQGGEGGGIPGVGQAGAVTLTAEPTQAWVEVEGQRLEFEVSGSIHHQCHIAGDQVRINYQQTEAGDLLIQGQNLGEGWLLNLTVAALDSNVSYGAVLPGNGSLGLDDTALSFEGEADRVEDFDIANARPVDIALAVNCTPPGDAPVAVVDGTEYVVPFSGSVTCEVTDDMIEVNLGGSSASAEIQMSAQRDAEGWLGHAVVYTPEGENFTSTISPEGDGPAVEGSTVSYSGTFGSNSGDVEGSVTFTCP